MKIKLLFVANGLFAHSPHLSRRFKTQLNFMEEAKTNARKSWEIEVASIYYIFLLSAEAPVIIA